MINNEIKFNLDSVKEKIGNNNQVCLVAVSKTKPVEMLQEVYNLGVRDFGENKVQEIVEKYDQLPKDINWHMIGHLQRNKVKYIIDKVSLIHSVDSFRLAEEISKEALKHNLCMPILIEVNVAKEESKYGFSMDEVEGIVNKISKLGGIMIKGFMTVAPFTDDSEDNRSIFRQLYELFIDIKGKNIDNTSICILSMGMTGDYVVAIEEGATLVRVGTGIFGSRTYNNL